jgi:hypothetical protein
LNSQFDVVVNAPSPGHGSRARVSGSAIAAIIAWATVTTGTGGPVAVRSVVIAIFVASPEVRFPPIVVFFLVAAVVAAPPTSHVLPSKLKSLLVVSLVSISIVPIPVSVVAGEQH